MPGFGSRAGSEIPAVSKRDRRGYEPAEGRHLRQLRHAARAAMEGGASGIAAINTVKSITNVNLDTYAAAPAVRGRSAVGGYSGAAVKPIALRFLADLGGDPALKGTHLSGMGGIETWRDAVEFLLLGAGSLQITTAVMQYGYRIINDLLQGLRIYMAQRGYQTVRFDKETRKPILIPQNCVGCHLCVLVCPREAISGGGRWVNAVKMD